MKQVVTLDVRPILAAGHEPRSVLVSARRVDEVRRILGERAVPVLVVPDEVAEQVTGYQVHRGALAAMRRPAALRPRHARRCPRST